jgi:uncharacterized membrane protein YfcA
MSPSPEMLCFLFLCGGIGGFIDSIAGGGGLITVPALLAAGLPPQLALGTNKAQSSVGTMVAVTRYVRGGLVDWPLVRGAATASFLSSAVGAWAVSLISNEFLREVVPWLLLAIVAYVMFSPKLGEHSGQAKLQAGAFGLLFGATLGFYDGFFGPGTGAFWTIATVTLLGLELRRATAYTKVVNLASNLGSLLVFACKGARRRRHDRRPADRNLPGFRPRAHPRRAPHPPHLPPRRHRHHPPTPPDILGRVGTASRHSCSCIEDCVEG